MVFLGEEKAQARFFEQFSAQFRALLDVDAKSFQAVRRTALRGSRPVPMFGDLHASRGSHQGGSCGNVEAVGSVPAGSDDFKEIVSSLHFGGAVPHGRGAARDFHDGFSFGAFCGKGGQERRVLGGGSLSGHNFTHNAVSFVIGKVFFIYNFYDCFFNHGSLLRYI